MKRLCTPRQGQAEFFAAELIALALRTNPELVLGLATGRTMKGVYAQLVLRHREDGLDFSRCQTFNLDEYVGLPVAHPGSFRSYMEEHLFRHVNLPAGRSQLPDGLAPDVGVECRRYEGQIRAAGGIDLQLLGLGLSGHIGFNEPGSECGSSTHLARLTAITRTQNAGPFGGKASAVPANAITMGLGTIMAARSCLLVVTSAEKASILARALEGPVTPLVPGSLLQLHPDCQVIFDQAASTELASEPLREP